MSPHAEGKKGTCHTDIVYAVKKRGRVGGGEQPRNYACTGASASQKTVGHEGMLTLVNALARMHNNSADP